jgi:hypothetical protein
MVFGSSTAVGATMSIDVVVVIAEEFEKKMTENSPTSSCVDSEHLTKEEKMNAAKIAPFLGPKATIEANVDSDSDGSDTVSLGRHLLTF